MEFKTTDLCDAHTDKVRVADPIFLDFGGKVTFGGKIATVKVFEDNSLVRTALEEPGKGRVLVVDGGGSLRCALVGDLLAELGCKNGWAGIVVNGCVRDIDDMGEIGIGVKALSTHPMKSIKRGQGERDVTVHFADVDFVPGQYVYADSDGIIVSAEKLV